MFRPQARAGPPTHPPTVLLIPTLDASGRKGRAWRSAPESGSRLPPLPAPPLLSHRWGLTCGSLCRGWPGNLSWELGSSSPKGLEGTEESLQRGEEQLGAAGGPPCTCVQTGTDPEEHLSSAHALLAGLRRSSTCPQAGHEVPGWG